MKSILFLSLLLLSVPSIAQTQKCDCSAPLRSDLATKIVETEYRKLKIWVYEYLKSSSDEQRKKKREERAGWSATATTVIDAIPVKNTSTGNWSSDKNDEVISSISQESERAGYLSDEQFNQICLTTMGDNQLAAYRSCLDVCRDQTGISFVISGDTMDRFSIRIDYRSRPSGVSIRVKDEAIFTNLEPLGRLVFKDKMEIKDGQSITQFFKRIHPEQAALFSFNTYEAIQAPTLLLSPALKANGYAAPIGTIIASVLNYGAFLEVNGLPTTADMSKAIWVPCDGRSISRSKYSDFGTVPDLRGLFLRGSNDYPGSSYPGVAIVNNSHKNPDDTKAGIFQSDAIISHHHRTNMEWGGNWTDRGNGWGVKYDPDRTFLSEQNYSNPGGAAETRPRNMTVYYYIKIN